MDQKTCNSSIHCTVENCAYSSPTSCKGTECASFQLK